MCLSWNNLPALRLGRTGPAGAPAQRCRAQTPRHFQNETPKLLDPNDTKSYKYLKSNTVCMHSHTDAHL